MTARAFKSVASTIRHEVKLYGRARRGSVHGRLRKALGQNNEFLAQARPNSASDCDILTEEDYPGGDSCPYNREDERVFSRCGARLSAEKGINATHENPSQIRVAPATGAARLFVAQSKGSTWMDAQWAKFRKTTF